MIEKLYSAASDVIEKTLKKEASMKSLCFSHHFRNKKLLFALVVETLKYHKILTLVLKECPDLWKGVDKEPPNSLQLVLLYEALVGKGVPSQLPYGKVIQKKLTHLHDVWQEQKKQYPQLLSYSDKNKVNLPRYVRVNVLKTSTEIVVEKLQQDGKKLVERNQYNDLHINEFCIDKDIPDLLVFASRTDFHKNEMYRKGEILLQDKASCLPAFILNPPRGSIIIDACAAPGNKSSHLACLTKNQSKIFSFDLDRNRLKLMQKLLHISASTSVKTKHQDFLKVQHSDPLYSKVEYILLDPSCSGSGIVSRMDELLDDKDTVMITNESRLKGLSGFQTAALSHALSFPNVKKVVYSTCSVHKEENEDVVEKAYKRFKETFELCHVFPKWATRGQGMWDQAYKCIRAIPTIDETNGFFVALFERINVIKNIQTEIQTCETKDIEGNIKLKKSKRKRGLNFSLEVKTEPFACKRKRKKRTGVKQPVARPTEMKNTK